MKLLLDQNISFRITNKIQDLFPGSKQVRDLGLENSKDSSLRTYAKENDLSEILGIKVDLVTTGVLKNKRIKKSIKKDLIKIL